MKMSEQINEIVTALAKARGEMGTVVKDSTNPHYKSKYGSLNSYLDACVPVLSKHGLFVSQIPSQTESGLQLITIIFHSSGQSIESYLPIVVKCDGRSNELQAFGSVLSYLKRYALSSMLGMAAEDDDGNSGTDYKAPASSNNPKVEPAPATPQFISLEQANELRTLIARCDADFTTKIMGYIGTNGMPSIEKMFTSYYEPIKKRILKFIAEESIKEAQDDAS